MKMEMGKDEVCGSQADVEGRKKLKVAARGQKEIDCTQSKRQKNLHGRFFQDSKTREGKKKKVKQNRGEKKRKDKKLAASEPQGRKTRDQGGAALANRRLSFERPCDQLISHADLITWAGIKELILEIILQCTLLFSCATVQLSAFHCMRRARHAKTFDVLDHFPIGTLLALAVAVLKLQRAAIALRF